LGEIIGDRLITRSGKKSSKGSSFTPSVDRVGVVKSANYVGNVMYVGYEDFPKAEDL